MEQAADLLGVGRTTAYRYCVNGQIPCVKINRKIFIRRKDIDLMFEEADPYEVTPLNRAAITEFYSMQEIMEKYHYSEGTVYNAVRAKRIPKTLCQGRTIYSKKHIDRYFSQKMPDPEITEWYTVEDIREKCDMSVTAVNCFTSENAIPRKKIKKKTYYSSKHVDALLAQRKSDPSIREWYSMEDIVAIYKLEPNHVSSLVYKNTIPRKKGGHKGYYSKTHFDAMMQEKYPQHGYYTPEEAAEKYGISRNALYNYLRRHNIPVEKEGRYVRVLKLHIDKLFANQTKPKKPWEQK